MQRYCLLNSTIIIDLATGLKITANPFDLDLNQAKIYFFESQELDHFLKNLPQYPSGLNLTKINLFNVQVSTDFQNVDELINKLQVSNNNYFRLCQWIEQQLILKNKYLNLLFKRRKYWDDLLNNKITQETQWSDWMLQVRPYKLIDLLYNQPAPVESVKGTVFNFLELLPKSLAEYFDELFIQNNEDERELKREYQRFINRRVRVDGVNEYAKFTFFGMELKLTNGGLHYNADNYFEKPIKLIDFKAYYPTLMVTFDFQSRRITVPEQRNFLREWLQIRNDLSDRDQDKIPDEIKVIKNKFKIFQSSLYGCLRDRQGTSNIYDPVMGLMLTLVGQWLMLAFIKALKPFIKKIYGINTDGLFLEWRNEIDDWDRIERVVNRFYNLTKIRYSYEQYDRCFFFKFNQLLCQRLAKSENNDAPAIKEVVYGRGDFFKNYETNYDDEYYITKALTEFYLWQKPINFRTYPVSFFKKTFSLKANYGHKKQFIFYESKQSFITIADLQRLIPQKIKAMQAICPNFGFQSIAYHRRCQPKAFHQENLITVYPAQPVSNAVKIRIVDKTKTIEATCNSSFFYFDPENLLTFVFELNDFNAEKPYWTCSVKYSNEKIANSADWYVFEAEVDERDIDFKYCYQRVKRVIASLPANNYFKKYPNLKKEVL